MALTPDDPTAWGLPATSVEVVAARGRHSKTFSNADGTTTLITRPNIHYPVTGGWDDVNCTFVQSGTSWQVTASDVQITVSGTSLSLTDTVSGKGINYTLPATPTVSGNTLTLVANGITWTYIASATGAKLEANVSVALGKVSYRWNYARLGGALAFTVGADGSLISDAFSIGAPIALGADGVSYPIGSWTATSTRITLAVDDTTLPPAAFPYTFDPTTVFNVAATADDGLWDGTSFGTTSSEIFGNLLGVSYFSFFRFANITVPNAATITAASITFKAASSLSNATCNIDIKAVDQDNAAAITSIADYNSRPITSIVTWSAVPATTANATFTTPDISTPVQAVINRAGWASGNALCIFVGDSAGTPSSSSARRNCFDFSTGTPASLSITYTAAVANIVGAQANGAATLTATVGATPLFSATANGAATATAAVSAPALLSGATANGASTATATVSTPAQIVGATATGASTATAAVIAPALFTATANGASTVTAAITTPVVVAAPACLDLTATAPALTLTAATEAALSLSTTAPTVALTAAPVASLALTTTAPQLTMTATAC